MERVIEGMTPFALATLTALALSLLAGGRVRWGWLGAAAAAMVAYELALTGVYGAVSLPIESAWNWSGKIMALGLALALASLPVLGWRRVGLTLDQGPGWRGALAVSAVLALLFLGLALRFPGEGVDAETLAFQLTMPGLDEELFYRGVLLLMLNEAFGRPIRVLGAPMGWGAVVSSLAFAAVHAVGYEDGGFTLNAVALATTGSAALILVWLREKTGSLLLPVLLHNFGNSIFLLV